MIWFGSSSWSMKLDFTCIFGLDHIYVQNGTLGNGRDSFSFMCFKIWGSLPIFCLIILEGFLSGWSMFQGSALGQIMSLSRSLSIWTSIGILQESKWLCELGCYYLIILILQSAMQKFTQKIVQMMKDENLFESQGGPIILSQVWFSVFLQLSCSIIQAFKRAINHKDLQLHIH